MQNSKELTRFFYDPTRFSHFFGSLRIFFCFWVGIKNRVNYFEDIEEDEEDGDLLSGVKKDKPGKAIPYEGQDGKKLKPISIPFPVRGGFSLLPAFRAALIAAQKNFPEFHWLFTVDAAEVDHIDFQAMAKELKSAEMNARKNQKRLFDDAQRQAEEADDKRGTVTPDYFFASIVGEMISNSKPMMPQHMWTPSGASSIIEENGQKYQRFDPDEMEEWLYPRTKTFIISRFVLTALLGKYFPRNTGYQQPKIRTRGLTAAELDTGNNVIVGGATNVLNTPSSRKEFVIDVPFMLMRKFSSLLISEDPNVDESVKERYARGFEAAVRNVKDITQLF